MANTPSRLAKNGDVVIFTHSMWSFTIVLLVATAADAGTTSVDPLANVLKLAGESEKKKADTGCTFVEDSVIEQLSSDGKSEGKVIRRHETTVKDAKIVSRKLVSKKVEGDPSSMMVKEQDPNNDPQYSAFHPSQQSLYTYRLEGSADAEELTVRFTPRKANEKRLRGVATINRNTGLVTKIEGAPSDLPALLDEFTMTMEQSETRCGAQMTNFKMSGKGGLLFFRTRFRGTTTLSEHANK